MPEMRCETVRLALLTALDAFVTEMHHEHADRYFADKLVALVAKYRARLDGPAVPVMSLVMAWRVEATALEQRAIQRDDPARDHLAGQVQSLLSCADALESLLIADSRPVQESI